MSDTCEFLQLAQPAHRSRAVDVLIEGQIIVLAFNGIYTLVGDADDPTVPARIAMAKGRPEAKGVALVCPPEHLAEHVAHDAPVFRTAYPFAKIQELYGSVHALGLIFPAAVPGAPDHVTQNGTILNVWTEQRPESTVRQLITELRQRGRRALVGTSANLTRKPTVTETEEVRAIFGERVPLMLLDGFADVPASRRRSASIIDLTGPVPTLVREGSVSAEELRQEMSNRGLGRLEEAPDLRHV